MIASISNRTSQSRQLRNVPTVGGPSVPILSWYGSFQMLKRGPVILEEAYNLYKGTSYKFADIKGWHVVVSGPRLVDELLRTPDDMLSVIDATRQMLQIDYTLGSNVADNEYHIPLVRSQLTRSLDRIYPQLYEEAVSAITDELPLKGDGWITVKLMDVATQVVSRTSNRAFVGLPVCRDPDYCALTKEFAKSVIMCASVVNLFPAILQPIVGRFTSILGPSTVRGAKYLGPVIQERHRMRQEFGEDWTNKPDDFLQLLMDAAPPEENTITTLTARVLTMNFAAIHTTSTAFTQALYRIASNPSEYLPPLREEIETVVSQEGWAKSSVGKMRKLDSFLKETLRMAPLAAVLTTRRTRKDHTFSDGTHIPAGTYVSTPVLGIHRDDEIYPNADQFDPWRFSNMRAEDGEGTKHQFVSTTVDYIPFGHGRHACPGRFFAAMELKTMIAHIITMYDVKMENEGVFPPSMSFATAIIPDMKAKVMFRKRKP
ncbi:cytochrome P450 [Amylocystis lapponica]|nr:cytochrome P450 [Amylocystis lapponica]